MDHFNYKDGRLAAEDVALATIADDVATPFYAYSTATLERHYLAFAQALSNLDSLICFSVKANSNTAVIRTLGLKGAGADVVSGGELQRALSAGIAADKIVFSGVGKTAAELSQALQAGILQINVESEPELETLNRVATGLGVVATVGLRINPDVDANTHAKITTGKGENKFGIEWPRTLEVYRAAARMPALRPVGLAVHIGSQLADLEPFGNAFRRLADLTAQLRAEGLTVERLDLGGGLGVPYGDTGEPLPGPVDYAAVVEDVLGKVGCQLVFEPGRVIAANAGVLVTRVIYVKQGVARNFVIVDAAMNDLTRPSLYDAYHAIVPVNEPATDAENLPVDVVGPVCETGDTFGSQRHLPPVQAGDLLAIRSAGAYGATMASTYNTRALVPEVLVQGRNYAVVRRRVEIADLLDLERQPAWLSNQELNR